MTHPFTTFPVATALRLTSLALVFSFAAPALGQTPSGDEADDSKAKPAEATSEPLPAKPAAPPPQVAPAAAPAPPGPVGGVEWLPGSAFPEERIRGIYGGSLWRTLHGQQWPYYPTTGIGFSGSGWVDTGYEQISAGNPTDTGIKYVLQQGRLVLRVTPTYTHDNWFVQTQAEFVANKDQTVPPVSTNVDDLWIRTGVWRSWDITAGRFQAFEIYHYGLGLDLNTLERQGAHTDLGTPPDIYGGTFMWDRPTSIGNLALHFYPTNFLRIEALGQLGNENGLNGLGARPAVVLDLGWMKLKGAGEYRTSSAVKENGLESKVERGVAGALQFVIDPWVEFGGNVGYGLVDHNDVMGKVDQPGSFTIYSAGGFANVRIWKDLMIGGGGDYTLKWDIHYEPPPRNDTGHFSQLQYFLALQYIVYKKLFIKFVAAKASATFNPTFRGATPKFDNDMVSGRLRLEYLF